MTTPLPLAPAAPASRPAPDPVPPDERVVLLDVLRGFALWGVCLANLVPWLSGYSGLPPEAKRALPTWPVDRVVDALLGALVHGRFITIFSFLFGLGFAVQLLRAEARGDGGARLLARRLVALFAIGAAHAYLVWPGDITHIYAALGVVLLVARRWPVRRLVVAGAALLLAAPLAWLLATSLAPAFLDGALSPTATFEHLRAIRQQRAPALFGTGTTYAGILAGNRLLHDAMLAPWMSLGYLPELAGLFLLGLAAGRAGLLARLDGHARGWRTALAWSLAIGVIGYAPRLAIALAGVQARVPADARGVLQAMQVVAKPAMSLAYVCAVVLLFRRDAWRRRLLALAPVGRMAFTNYLSQSVVGIALFYGIGLGLWGRVGPTLLVALSVAIVGAQAVASRWWLARFRFGPAEWLWRSLTYGRAQPMRLRGPRAGAAEPAAA